MHTITDPLAGEVVAALRHRRGGPLELLPFRERRRWLPLRSDDINDYLKEHLGSEFSAKDFRTWNATVLAPGDDRGRARLEAAVLDLLGEDTDSPALSRLAA